MSKTSATNDWRGRSSTAIGAPTRAVIQASTQHLVLVRAPAGTPLAVLGTVAVREHDVLRRLQARPFLAVGAGELRAPEVLAEAREREVGEAAGAVRVTWTP